MLVACHADWYAIARLPRVLASAGCEVHAFCAADHALASTRFVDAVHAAPRALPAFVDAFRDHVVEHGRRYCWIVVADDPLLAAIGDHPERTWLESWYPVAPSSDAARLLASKAEFALAAERAGSPIPASRVCSTFAEVEAAAAELGYPLVLKQSLSCAGFGVRAAHGPAELAAGFHELARALPLVAQRVVRGPIGSTMGLWNQGRPICWMSAYKVRTMFGPFGPSSARQFIHHDDAEPLVTQLGAMTGYHGLGALDWVRDEASDRLQVIEFNARPVPALHLGPLAGIDFAKSIEAMLSGSNEVQRPPPLPAGGPVVSMFPEDCFRALLAGELRALLQWVPRRGTFNDIPWDDPRLLLYYLQYAGRMARNHLEESKRSAK